VGVVAVSRAGCCADLVVTCGLGMERVVASYIAELDSGVEVVPAPRGFSGLVLVYGARASGASPRRLRGEFQRLRGSTWC
jgi:tRNA(Ser,Leu) C12 N-acetylase TAN1